MFNSPVTDGQGKAGFDCGSHGTRQVAHRTRYAMGNRMAHERTLNLAGKGIRTSQQRQTGHHKIVFLGFHQFSSKFYALSG